MRRFAVTRNLWHSSGLVIVWAGLLIVSLLVTVAVSFFRDITISGWGVFVFISPWYMLGMGVYVTAIYLPMYIAHGVTRRQCLSQALLFGLLLVTVGAALVTLGFGIERAVYAVADWPQALEADASALYTSADQYGWIFLGFWLGFAIFLAVGAAIAAAFYRRAWGGVGGLLLVVAGLILIVPAGMASATNIPTKRILEQWADSVGTAAILTACVLAALAATAATWALVRDMPIRLGSR
ncbi:hypothetical protein [Nocardia sp. NPDC050406]|uniref:hypothetical protein n=1 Tax=Nocardia sp. NPDC050406 TaxID=3364318 RepID=UPI0037BB68FD